MDFRKLLLGIPLIAACESGEVPQRTTKHRTVVGDKLVKCGDFDVEWYQFNPVYNDEKITGEKAIEILRNPESYLSLVQDEKDKFAIQSGIIRASNELCFQEYMDSQSDYLSVYPDDENLIIGQYKEGTSHADFERANSVFQRYYASIEDQVFEAFSKRTMTVLARPEHQKLMGEITMTYLMEDPSVSRDAYSWVIGDEAGENFAENLIKEIDSIYMHSEDRNALREQAMFSVPKDKKELYQK